MISVSMEGTTLLLLGVLVLILGTTFYLLKEYKTKRKTMDAKNIDQQMIKEEMYDAKKNAKNYKGSKIILEGDKSIMACELGKVSKGLKPYPKFVTVFISDSPWSHGIVDIYRPLAPAGFDSKTIVVKGIGLHTKKGRSTVIPSADSGVSLEEVRKEWNDFKKENHLEMGIAQSITMVNKGIFEASNMKGTTEKEVVKNMDGWDYVDLASKGVKHAD